MAAPQDLSIEEIRKYMLENGCRVTNHSLVKHFKRFLTNPELQNEARNQFKTYVNILATIKNENNQKYLVLRKKFINECPTVKGESSGSTKTAVSDDEWASPFRHAMPNKPTPDDFSQPAEQMEKNLPRSVECLTDFRKDKGAIKQKLDLTLATHSSQYNKASFPTKDSELAKMPKSIPGHFIDDAENSENIPVRRLSSNISIASPDMKSEKKNTSSDCGNPISVKEATKKFNRMASEEEVKVISPSAKKKAEKPLIEEKITTDLLLAHSKAKEWIVVMARGSYQEVAKLANEFPELVKLQDPSTGTAVHWAAKHGNEDVIKLIAGSYKADVNARTNGGYTPLHLAMQFGHENIFELLCNVYKADRDLTDFSGNKPLDYLKQCTSASLATYTNENSDLSDASFSSEHFTHNSNTLSTFRHITSGGSISAPLTSINKRSNLWSATIPTAASSSLTRTQSMMTSSKCNLHSKKISSTSIVTGNDGVLSCGLISSNYKRNPYSQDIAEESKVTSEDRHVTTLNTNRKKSFLRKTLRAATVSNRSNIAAVPSNMLME